MMRVAAGRTNRKINQMILCDSQDCAEINKEYLKNVIVGRIANILDKIPKPTEYSGRDNCTSRAGR